MRPPIARWGLALFDLLWPPLCAACGEAAWTGSVLCLPCAEGLEGPVPRCVRCGRPTGPYAVSVPCAGCRFEDWKVDAVIARWPYRHVARTLVLALKFRGRIEVAPFLGAALADALLAEGVPGDLLVPVPLSRRRRRERGFNQAELIARAAAGQLDVAVDARALVRRRHAAPQVGQSRGRRRLGPRGAFRARRSRVAGRSVLLVDDVLTTGATARAAALALRRAGAASVVAAVVCRA